MLKWNEGKCGECVQAGREGSGGGVAGEREIVECVGQGYVLFE